MGEHSALSIKNRLTSQIKKLDPLHKSIVSMQVNEKTGKAIVRFINRYGNEREETFLI